MRAAVSSLLLVTAALLSAGCLPLRSVDALDAVASYSRIDRPAPRERAGAIEVVLVTTPDLGGVLHELPKPSARPDPDERRAAEMPGRADGPFRCDFFMLDPAASAKAAIEERAEAVPHAIAGVHVRGFSQALATLLRFHLAQRFEAVDLRVVSPQELEDPATSLHGLGDVVIRPEAEYYQTLWRTSLKEAFVSLEASRPGLGPTSARGDGEDRVALEHLVWAIPVTFASVVTVPLGVPSLIASQLVLADLEEQAIGAALIQAMDAAASELARKLAERPRRPVVIGLGG